jgi:hypothetical protein
LIQWLYPDVSLIPQMKTPQTSLLLFDLLVTALFHCDFSFLSIMCPFTRCCRKQARYAQLCRACSQA